jgi:hypothetical protein
MRPRGTPVTRQVLRSASEPAQPAGEAEAREPAERGHLDRRGRAGRVCVEQRRHMALDLGL